MQKTSETGECANCQSVNARTSLFCQWCGEKLPWADDLVQQNLVTPAEANRQERIAARLKAALEERGADPAAQASSFQPAPELEPAEPMAAPPELAQLPEKLTPYWGPFKVVFLGCFGVCVLLLVMAFIVAMLTG